MSSGRTPGALVIGTLLTLFAPDVARAAPGGHPFGLGLHFGDHIVGITGKYYLGTGAIEGVVGSWNDDWFDDGWYVHGTYQWHPSTLASGNGFDLNWHVGVGGFLAESYRGWGNDDWWDDDDVIVGFRVPLGLEFDLANPRFQFTGDLAANVPLVPDFGIDLDISIAVRYYF